MERLKPEEERRLFKAAFNGARIGAALKRATVTNLEDAAAAGIELAKFEVRENLDWGQHNAFDDVTEAVARVIEEAQDPIDWHTKLRQLMRLPYTVVLAKEGHINVVHARARGAREAVDLVKKDEALIAVFDGHTPVKCTTV